LPEQKKKVMNASGGAEGDNCYAPRSGLKFWWQGTGQKAGEALKGESFNPPSPKISGQEGEEYEN